MKFDSWLEDHLKKDKKLPQRKITQDAVELFERRNDTKIVVYCDPQSVVVVDSEAAGKWELLESHKPPGWTKRCDYLLVGELENRYFAVFVELKTTYKDSEGKEQLRWTKPLLHYLLSIFNIYLGRDLDASDFTIKYWKICEDISQEPSEPSILEDNDDLLVLKPTVTHQEDSPTYFSQPYKGLTIHNRNSIPIELQELVQTPDPDPVS